MDFRESVYGKLEGKPLLALLTMLVLEYLIEPLYAFLEKRVFGRWKKKTYTDFEEVNKDVKEAQSNA